MKYSAAPCINEQSSIELGYALNGDRLGEYDQFTYFDCTHSIDIPIEKLISHENYTLGNNIHDIALLRLKKFIIFSHSIRPICLPSVRCEQRNYDNVSLTVAGWGETEIGKINSLIFYLFND